MGTVNGAGGWRLGCSFPCAFFFVPFPRRARSARRRPPHPPSPCPGGASYGEGPRWHPQQAGQTLRGAFSWLLGTWLLDTHLQTGWQPWGRGREGGIRSSLPGPPSIRPRAETMYTPQPIRGSGNRCVKGRSWDAELGRRERRPRLRPPAHSKVTDPCAETTR